jgi:hypothetical protein
MNWLTAAAVVATLALVAVILLMGRSLYGRAYKRGYSDGAEDGLPSIGVCGKCGWEGEPGTLFEVVQATTDHVKECGGPVHEY